MKRNLLALVAVVLLLPACSDGAGDAIEISDAWARTSAAMTSAGAVYMQIHNPAATDDVLLRATADASVASTVEIHETAPMETTSTMGGETGSTMGSGEMMTMRPVDRIVIPAGGTMALEPGGYHVMLIGLVQPLETGSAITITLVFEQAGEIEVEADVRDAAP
ncbi:MAG TPA: copper chaperone PCu(A)C [Acidimicrobiia bacterium]|nr:copper chaperone PCu(A)C [Acidimicrobiia bacterium]